mgnify:CR=1 FL=1
MEKSITATAAFKAAEVYEQFFVPGIFRYWTPQLLRRALPKPGQTVLDVACGTGIVARSTVPLVGKGGRVVGLDINPAMMETACQQFGDHCEYIEWREGWAEQLPFTDQEFNLVTCQQGLQFFRDRAQAAREMRRVLKSGGRAVIEVWQPLKKQSLYGAFFNVIAEVFQIKTAEIATPYSFGNPDDLKFLLAEAGFRKVQVEEITQDVRFENTDRFVELTIRAAGAVVPAFAALDQAAQSDLMEKAACAMAAYIDEMTVNGVLIFPTAANIATAVR